MNPERRRRTIERAALRAALKAQKRSGTLLTRDELLALKVQTAPWWLRLFVMLFGAGIIVGGIAVIAAGSAAGILFGILIVVVGVAFAITGWIGRKKTLESILETFGDGIAEAILRIVLDALDGL